jgi:hypothetical protein
MAETPTTDDPINFLRLAEIAVYGLYGRTLVGNPAPRTADIGERMRDFRVGDLVLETSTIYHEDRLGERLGRLLRIAEEPVYTADQWAANGGGDEPIPTHTVWYLRLPDGREYGWYNASFIAVPERPFFSLGPVDSAFGIGPASPSPQDPQ